MFNVPPPPPEGGALKADVPEQPAGSSGDSPPGTNSEGTTRQGHRSPDTRGPLERMRRGESTPILIVGWAIAICSLGFYGLPRFEPRGLHRFAETCISAVWITVLLALLFVTEEWGTIIMIGIIGVALGAFVLWVTHDARYSRQEIRRARRIEFRRKENE